MQADRSDTQDEPGRTRRTSESASEPRSGRESECPAELLLSASRRGQLSLVNRLLREGVNPDLRDKSGSTALIEACRHGHTFVAQSLIKSGSGLEVSDAEGFTPLMAAVVTGHRVIAKILLGQGADIEACNSDGENAVMLAATHNHQRILADLLDAGANFHNTDSFGRSALAQAAVGGHIECVLALIQRGANPNQTDRESVTPLMCAAEGGHTAVARILLAAGANIGVRSQNGRTALDLALVAGHSAICSLLQKTDHGHRAPDDSSSCPGTSVGLGNPSGTGIQEQTSTEDSRRSDRVAARSTEPYSLVSTPLDPGSLDTGDKLSLIWLATRYDWSGLAEIVLEKPGGGIDRAVELIHAWIEALYSPDLDPWEIFAGLGEKIGAMWPFGDAEENPSDGTAESQVKCLPPQEANFCLLESRDMHGDTPLIEASRQGNEQVPRTLLNHSADVRARNTRGQTPLIAAVAGESPVLVALLLTHGASPYDQDETGDTAISLGIRKNNSAVLKQLSPYFPRPTLTPIVSATDSENHNLLTSLTKLGDLICSQEHDDVGNLIRNKMIPEGCQGFSPSAMVTECLAVPKLLELTDQLGIDRSEKQGFRELLAEVLGVFGIPEQVRAHELGPHEVSRSLFLIEAQVRRTKSKTEIRGAFMDGCTLVERLLRFAIWSWTSLAYGSQRDKTLAETVKKLQGKTDLKFLTNRRL